MHQPEAAGIRPESTLVVEGIGPRNITVNGKKLTGNQIGFYALGSLALQLV